MRYRYLMTALALIAIVFLGGCSGGRAGGITTAGGEAAPSQVAASTYIQQWAQIMWGLVVGQTGEQTPEFGAPVANPDGSVSQPFTAADGTEVLITVFQDGSTRLDSTYPDGTEQVIRQSVPQTQGTVTTIDWQVESPNGLTVVYTSTRDTRGTLGTAADDRHELNGASTLPGGLTQQFEAVTDAGNTHIRSEQSDGSVFIMDTPLEAPEFAYPDFGVDTTGTYHTQDMDVTFAVRATPGAPSRWARMETTFQDNLRGVFALDEAFGGTGHLLRDEETLAVISWRPDGETNVQFLSAESEATSPSGAAEDYLHYRWQTLTALLAPAPGVSSVSRDKCPDRSAIIVAY